MRQMRRRRPSGRAPKALQKRRARSGSGANVRKQKSQTRHKTCGLAPEPEVGFEPTTYALRERCSTTELSGRDPRP